MGQSMLGNILGRLISLVMAAVGVVLLLIGVANVHGFVLFLVLWCLICSLFIVVGLVGALAPRRWVAPIGRSPYGRTYPYRFGNSTASPPPPPPDVFGPGGF